MPRGPGCAGRPIARGLAMIERILVAINDSPAGLAAFRSALDLTQRYAAVLRVVHVVSGAGVITGGSRGAGRSREVGPLLQHVTALADQAAVPIETLELDGEPAHRILEQANSWPADLVVIGRADHQGAGGPWVGRETRMVLEFADQPVLVVPRESTPAHSGPAFPPGWR